MRYTKKFGLFASAIVLGLAFMAVSASAQVRIGVRLGGGGYYHRPRIVQRYYAPIYPYGFYGRPYGRYYSERRYDKQSLNYAKRRLSIDEEKTYADGYVTPKEEQKLQSDYSKLNRDRRRLRNDY